MKDRYGWTAAEIQLPIIGEGFVLIRKPSELFAFRQDVANKKLIARSTNSRRVEVSIDTTLLLNEREGLAYLMDIRKNFKRT